MSDSIYNNGNFVVFRAGTGYIVYNKLKPFTEGHTHIKNKKSALDAVNFVRHCKIPKRTSDYYLLSLIRLSTNEKYIQDIQALRDVRRSKGTKQKYYRPTK